MKLTREEREVLINLICKKQTKLISKDRLAYESKKYIGLEKLKIKIKDSEIEYKQKGIYEFD